MPATPVDETAPVLLDPVSPGRPSSIPWGRASFVVVTASLVILFYALGLHQHLSWPAVKENLHHWQQITRENLLLSVVLYFAAYTLATSLSLPVTFLMSVLCGALFDWWLGVGVASLASTAGATVSFLSSRYLLRSWVRRRFGHRLTRLDRGVHADGGWYLFSLRLTPVVPFFLINLGMGLTPMRLRTFVLVSWLGMLPVKCLLVRAGSALGSIDDPREILSLSVVLSLMLLGLGPLAVRLLARAFHPLHESS